MKLPRRATVWWHDAHHSSGDWDDAGGANSHKPALCGNTGWVVYSDRIGLSMAFELDPGDMGAAPYRDRQFIPRGMVIRIDYWDDAPAAPT